MRIRSYTHYCIPLPLATHKLTYTTKILIDQTCFMYLAICIDQQSLNHITISGYPLPMQVYAKIVDDP